MKLDQIHIRNFLSSEELHTATLLLMATDPWKTFGRTYANCYDAVSNTEKESWGAFLGGKFLGVLVLDLSGPFKGYIQAVCVEQDARRKGYGTRLIEFAEKRIFTVSPNCFLCFSDFNASVKPVYEKLGYKVVGALDDFIIAGHMEYLMRKTIGPTMSFTPTNLSKT